jgi:hypothetical protein
MNSMTSIEEWLNSIQPGDQLINRYGARFECLFIEDGFPFVAPWTEGGPGITTDCIRDANILKNLGPRAFASKA